MRLVPRPIARLRAYQIADAALHRRMVRLARSHEAEQRPCGLRCRARRWLIPAVIEPVALPALAPPAVGVLDGQQEIDAPAHLARPRVYTGSAQGTQRRPCTVNVVHAPPSVPAPVG